MSPQRLRCILLTGQQPYLADAAESFARILFDVRYVGRQARHQKQLDPAVQSIVDREPIDFLFNFLSPVIVPGSILGKIGQAAVNFHPAPPEWPGVGSASFALYHGDSHFGATAHLMTEGVDSGPILRTHRFPIAEAETCGALFDRALHYSLLLFYELLNEIRAGGTLLPSGERWKRKPISRKTFEAWMILSPSDSLEEVQRKTRALQHDKLPGPFLRVGDRLVDLSAKPSTQSPATEAERPTIPWWTPQVTPDTAARLAEVLQSNFLNDGDVTARFERELAGLLGAKHAVAVTSGTAALFLALSALEIGPGDEVLVPDVTFIATANAVKMTGATPVLVDVEPVGLTLDVTACARAITSKTKAILPVHISGRSADMPALLALARAHGLAIVEDAAQALLSRSMGHCLGTLGQAGCFSFSPNKLITTGQGGAVVTDSEPLYTRLRELKDQGRALRGTGGADLHPTIGYNFKFTNLQAAVGLEQLRQLPSRAERMKAIYLAYAQGLRNSSGIRPFTFDLSAGESPQWIDVITEDADALEAYLAAQQIRCRRYWFPLHTQAPYRQSDATFPISTALTRQSLWLPSAFTLSDAQIAAVCEAIARFPAALQAVGAAAA